MLQRPNPLASRRRQVVANNHRSAPKSLFGQMFIEKSIPPRLSLDTLWVDHLAFKLQRKAVGDSPTVRRNSRLNWVSD
jgi:hypothetical protein